MDTAEVSTHEERGEGIEDDEEAGHDGRKTHLPELAKKMTDDNSDEKKNDRSIESEGDDSSHECSVCLQNCIHPVELPCKHIFCFLCVKGVANRSKRCALCRQEIPVNFFNNPNLIRQGDLAVSQNLSFDEGYQWFYEGRDGWWQYDDRTGADIEIRYKKGDKLFELLIAGFLYVIDLDNLVQYRRSDRTRCRRMKRDHPSLQDIKGVAGIKYSSPPIADRPGCDGGDSPGDGRRARVMAPPPPPDNNNDDNFVTPATPNNTPLTSQTPADSPPSSVSGSTQDLTAQLQQLNLQEESLSGTLVQTASRRSSRRQRPVISPSSSETEED